MIRKEMQSFNKLFNVEVFDHHCKYHPHMAEQIDIAYKWYDSWQESLAISSAMPEVKQSAKRSARSL